VKVIVRSGFEEMKASRGRRRMPSMRTSRFSTIMVPKAFVHENGKLTGVVFEKVKARSTTTRAGATWCRPASRTSTVNATTCSWRSARRTPSPGSSGSGIEFDKWGMPKVDPK
jgi:formate dehydrogenase beta subunit